MPSQSLNGKNVLYIKEVHGGRGRQQLYVFSDFKTKSEKQRVVLIILFAVEERVEQTKKMGADSQRECLRLQILGS